MLKRMFVGVPPGSYDRLLDFSTATTGTTFFVPTAAVLDQLAEPPQDGQQAQHDGAGAESQHPSRGIGSLRDAP